MRNIKILNEVLSNIGIEDSSILSSIYDSNENQFLLLTSKGQVLRIHLDTSTGDFFTENTWDIKSELETLKIDLMQITSITFQKFNEHLFLMTSSVVLRLELEKTSAVVLTKVYSMSNEDRILACKSSPDEELFAMVTTKEVLLMNRLFKPKNNLSLIKGDQVLLSAVILWRFDSMYFQVNMQEKEGRKVYTFDKSLHVEQSPSKYDPAYPLVRNVFENPRKKLSHVTSWTPNGGLTYGVIEQEIETEENNGKCIYFSKNRIFKKEDHRKDRILGEKWTVSFSYLFAI